MGFPVLIVVGTRPEAIKLVPIIRCLRDSEMFEPIVISTGQHELMVDEILAMAGTAADGHLEVGTGYESLNARVGNVMGRFEEFCIEAYGDHRGQMPTAEERLSGRYPVATFVHGDTSSAFAAALASFHLRIPVVHVEAGLRTSGLNLTPFPEELNRQLISCIAGFHLAPTALNQENLVREQIPANQIFVTGNTGIDALQWASELDLPFQDPRLSAIYESDARVVVVTAHRRENWRSGLARIAKGVARLAERYPDVRFVVLGFGGVLLGCAARGAPQGASGVARGLLVAHVYAFYSWLLWPVLLRSTARQLTERRDWAKTEREPVG